VTDGLRVRRGQRFRDLQMRCIEADRAELNARGTQFDSDHLDFAALILLLA
jgi:hypothetical protein